MAGCLAYDEDLTDNPFFETLRKEYTDLFYKIIIEGCVIAVPRVGSLPSYSITLDDILGHILLPSDEMPESHFNTLSGKEVKICNRVVTLLWESEQIFTNILFEETYYTKDMLKYKVVCLEHPLEPKAENSCDGVLNIVTLRDCMDFLNDGRCLTELFDNEISVFLKNKESIENASLQTLKELTSNLYWKCYQDALKDRTMKSKTSGNPHNLKNFKLSVETYIHHRIYKTLFRNIATCTAELDGSLNKIIRNCADVKPKDLEIRAEFHDLIPKAKTELSKMNGYGTVMGKLSCLKKMMTVLARDPESGGMLAADDLLPIIIFILLKVNITDWFAQLNYLKFFRFSSQTNGGQDEDEFLVTTLEAALEHIDSGVFLPTSCADSTMRLCDFTSPGNLNNLELLFDHASKGHLEELRIILESEQPLEKSQLCHPLCVCENCIKVIEVGVPKISSKNSMDMSVVHIAASYGQPDILDYLISAKADIEEFDGLGRTPLHHAALRGHQTVLLLLLQYGADVNSSDDFLNTPLHLCAINGHLTCVKALIYHCEHEGKKICINAQNNDGDTPLHHSTRYGYLAITQLLVSYDADPSIVNRRKLSSFQMASNSKVYSMLTESRPRFKCNLSLKIINFDFLDEGFEKGRVTGDLPLSAYLSKKVDIMLRAISHGDVNLACFYLGLNLVRGEKTCHPLCSCISCNKPTIPTSPSVEKVGINMCDSEGRTALHLAVQQGLYDFVVLLVSNDAKVDVQDRKLVTPLIVACQQQRTQIAAFMLEHGCSINLQDSKGNTALHYACIGGCKRIAEVLLRHKPNIAIRNKSGRNALQEAEAKISLSIVNLLKDFTNETDVC